MTPVALSPFGVRASAGSLRASDGVVLDHVWTDRGVMVSAVSNGAQVLHLSVAMCILNDTFREAERLEIPVHGVAVEVDGGFEDDWRSTGISYTVTLDSPAAANVKAHLEAAVDEVGVVVAVSAVWVTRAVRYPPRIPARAADVLLSP